MLVTSEFFVGGSGKMPQSAAPQTAHTRTVLVVDDDPTVVALCQKFLQQAGCAVLSASGSSEALKICKGHAGPIDVLVTDLVLPPPEFSFASSGNEFPHVHGHELAFRALQMRTDLRIILMSANIDNELAGYGIRKGALPFLTKPFDASTLVSTVQTALEGPATTPESLEKDQSSTVKPTDEWFD
jgi:DNA-binding NtrC family response regulator